MEPEAILNRPGGKGLPAAGVRGQEPVWECTWTDRRTLGLRPEPSSAREEEGKWKGCQASKC